MSEKIVIIGSGSTGMASLAKALELTRSMPIAIEQPSKTIDELEKNKYKIASDIFLKTK